MTLNTDNHNDDNNNHNSNNDNDDTDKQQQSTKEGIKPTNDNIHFTRKQRTSGSGAFAEFFAAYGPSWNCYSAYRQVFSI